MSNEDYSIGVDIERHQSVLQHAISKIDFSVVANIYMLPSNLKLDKGKTVICKKKLISTIGIKIISNKNIGKVEVYHEKF